MAIRSNISWCDSTWNIARGCRKKDADCLNCYMYRDSLDSKRYNPREVIKTKTVFNMPLKYKLTKSECWDGPPLIFTSSLTDVFLEEIDGYRNEVWDIIRKCPHLIFQILTKRPERILDHLPADWGNGWDNVWLGTSVGSPAGIERIDKLLQVPAKIRFLSLEPLWSQISLKGYDLSKIDWAIIGGESGNTHGKSKYRACELEWIESLIDELKPTTKTFVKQLGTHLSDKMGLVDRHGRDINEWPSHLQIQEFPDLKIAAPVAIAA